MHLFKSDGRVTIAETELTLLLPGAQPATIEARLRTLGVLARRRTSTQWLWSVYHDTPNQALRQQQHTLRLCCVSGRPWQRTATAATLRGTWIQSFRSASVSQGGVSRGGEWESRERTGRLNPLALRVTPWASLDPEGQLFATLQPCFETRCRRTVWTLHRYRGATIAVALDIGEITANGRSEPILELQIALRTGEPAALIMLAQEVGRVHAVLPCDVSTTERGYRLAEGNSHTAAAAVALRLPADATPLQAASLTLDATFNQFTSELALLLGSDAPEVVHHARVASRRWRSAVRLFAPWLPDPPGAGSLRPLLDELGPLRDLDVLGADTLGRWLPAFVDGNEARQQNADHAIERVGAARSAQCERARAVLCQSSTGLALLGLAGYLVQLRADAAAAPSGRAAPWAAKRIRKLQSRFEAALEESRRPQAKSEEVHRARIEAKRTRYAAEMLRDLLPAKHAKALTKAASAVQRRLGDTRDLQQAVRLLGQLQADASLVEFMRGVLARDVWAGSRHHAT
jgi:inorganic triphosphatase YgiF